MTDVNVHVILPERSEDALSEGLRSLTERIHKAGLADASGGLFGGAFGYGADYENATFLMHQFCWCEKDDCPWCHGCACVEAAKIERYVDGKPVTSHEYWNANKECFGNLWNVSHMSPSVRAEHGRRAEIRDQRLKIVWPAIIHTCGNAMLVDRPRGDTWLPRQQGPHFWHKPSGFRVWWYKYIGRDMEIHDPTSSGIDIVGLLRECEKSLAVRSLARRWPWSKSRA